MIQKNHTINMICVILNSGLACLQQSGHPVWPLLWREQMDHPGSSESGILFPWDTEVCPLDTHEVENSDLCGTPRYIRCPSNVERCLCTHNKEGERERESDENTQLSGWYALYEVCLFKCRPYLEIPQNYNLSIKKRVFWVKKNNNYLLMFQGFGKC